MAFLTDNNTTILNITISLGLEIMEINISSLPNNKWLLAHNNLQPQYHTVVSQTFSERKFYD